MTCFRTMTYGAGVGEPWRQVDGKNTRVQSTKNTTIPINHLEEFMKRRWEIVKDILEHIEAGDLYDTVQDERHLQNLSISEDDYVGHIEIMEDAGIIRNCEVDRNMNGEIVRYSVLGVFITMQGHDLLDAMRDKSLWSRIKKKSLQTGISLSWEFIKAAIPVVIREIIEKP